MKRARDERGAIAVIASLMMFTLLTFATISIDIGNLVFQRQGLSTTLDAAVLSGVAVLPDDPVGARTIAMSYALQNDPTLDPSRIDVSYRCVVLDADRNGVPDPYQIPTACDPFFGGSPAPTCAGDRCWYPCRPETGDRCNALVMDGRETASNAFGGAVGTPQSDTGIVRAAACKSGCGAATSPLDVVMILDRTRSMSDADVANVKDAALTFLEYMDPTLQHVGLGVINQSRITGQCTGSGYGRSITSITEVGTWVAYPYPVPSGRGVLSDDYLSGPGVVDPKSKLVRTISCLERMPGFSSPGLQTNFGDPVEAARRLLVDHGRDGVKKVIVFMSDGEANLPGGQEPCGYGRARADAAKADGIEVYTIGFGIGSKTCRHDRSGPYVGAPTTQVLAEMSSGADDNGCIQAENDDDDHFFCEPRSQSLRNVFVSVALKIAGPSRLIDLEG